jgi:hypothetical protein
MTVIRASVAGIIQGSITANIPVAEIRHIVLVAEADLDTRGLHRFVVDSFELSDQAAWALDKAFADALALGDVAALSAGKVLQDTLALSDVFSRTVSFNRAFTDALTLTDVVRRTAGKGLADALALADAGSLVCQGYADPSYFADAYVGELRTF